MIAFLLYAWTVAASVLAGLMPLIWVLVLVRKDLYGRRGGE